MKKFILKTTFFILPFIILVLVTEIFYKTDQGDLSKIAYLFTYDKYRSNIQKKYRSLPLKQESFAEINIKNNHQFTIITFGDSFSQQEKYDFNNIIANHKDIKLLNINHDLEINPIQSVIGLLNTEFFDRINTKYVIIQTVERYAIPRIYKIDKTKKKYIDSMLVIVDKWKQNDDEKQMPKGGIFNDKYLKIPYINLVRLFKQKTEDPNMYSVQTDRELFTDKGKKLLFYKEDVDNLKSSNKTENVVKLNRIFNYIAKRLKEKNIELIVLISPDKYDLYYDNIRKPHQYIRPVFFEIFDTLSKQYHYIPSKQILLKAIPNTKDVYYYDDTHWSPIAASLIGKAIVDTIRQNK